MDAQTPEKIRDERLTQATLLSYIDVFWGAAVFAALMVPVTLSLKKVDFSGERRVGH
jgi:hypothetical protein